MRDGLIETQLSEVIRATSLDVDLPDECLEAADRIEIVEHSILTENENSNCGRCTCLSSNPVDGAKTNGCHVLLLHDQTNDASIWKELKTLQTLSAFGFHCIAPNIPNCAFDDETAIGFIDTLAAFFKARQLVIVASSMAGSLLVPFLKRNCPPTSFNLMALVAIAISDTHRLDERELARNHTPCLILKGTFDTSIGLNAANKLKSLPNGRVEEVFGGKHLCHISQTGLFHKILVNFLRILLKASRKSALVTQI